MKTDLQIIDEVIELLSVPERWTKGKGARDKDGNGLLLHKTRESLLCK